MQITKDIKSMLGHFSGNFIITTRIKIIIYFITIVFIVFCTFNIIFYNMYSDNVKSVVVSEVNNSVAQTTEYVDLVMQNVENMADAIVSNPLIQQQMNVDAWDTAPSLMNIRDIVVFMKDLLLSINGADTITLYIENSKILLTTDFGLISNLEEDEQNWFKGVRKNYSKVKWVDFSSEKFFTTPIRNNNCITLVIPIYSNYSYNRSGVLLINVDKKILGNYLKLGNGSESFIMNENGEIVVYTSEGKNGDVKQFHEVLNSTRLKKKGYYLEQVQGEEKLVVFNTSQKTGWKFATLVPIQESIDKITKAKDYILLFLAANFISVIIISLLLSRKMFRPVKKLITFMRKVENGDFYVQIDDGRNDEFGYIFRNFDKMVERIRYLFQELFEEKLLKKDAELKLMQSQINPHFIHNIFNNMSWLLELERYEDLGNMIDSVSQYYKTSLNMGNSFICVSDNMEQLKSYASIQMIRFKNKFICEFDFDDDILEEKIPNLILQPLLENAICHGVEPCERFCTIRVTGYKQGEEIVFTIEDDGVGIHKEKLHEILESFRQDSAMQTESFALINIDKRIKLYYGESYGLEVVSEKNRGTKAIVTIPLKKDRVEIR